MTAGTGILFIMVGPSGAGKNTLMKHVQGELGNLPQLATMTTRDQRPGEVHGREHWFVSRDEFEDLIADHSLIEYTLVHNNDYYGTPRAMVDQTLAASHDLIADIDFLGAARVHTAYPDNTVVLFVTPSSLDVLAERLRERGSISDDEVEHRLERARFEMTYALQSDYLIINDTKATAAEQLRTVIETERAHRDAPAAGPAPVRHTIRGTVLSLVRVGDEVLARPTPDGFRLPEADVPGKGALPHTLAQQSVAELTGQTAHLEAVQDERFDFTAPHDVVLHGAPPVFGLTFLYRVTLAARPATLPAGWQWVPAERVAPTLRDPNLLRTG